MPANSLDEHIQSLLLLHPQLSARFPGIDLASLDVPAKQALLKELNTLLGIKPESFRSS